VTSTPVPEEQPVGPVVRDRRRIDPETGQVRRPQPDDVAADVAEATSAVAAEEVEARQVDDELSALERELRERTEDVQRVHAEYANYRKRVDRDRELVREQATGAVLSELLTVLDDIERARDHDELVGGFKSVGEALEAVVGKLGLEKYGVPGEPFDPTVHEALTHTLSADVTEATCVQVYQPGYRFAGRVLRPARVAVAEPQ
jgi:molecular chaperone GrpE